MKQEVKKKTAAKKKSVQKNQDKPATKKKKAAKKVEPNKPTSKPSGSPSPDKVFDVASPGKGAMPSSTSRPMIITRRPMARDPMMSGPKTDDAPQPDKPSAPPVSRLAKLRIEPLPGSADSEEKKAEEPTIEIIPDEKPDDLPDSDGVNTVEIPQAPGEEPEETEKSEPDTAQEEPLQSEEPESEVDTKEKPEQKPEEPAPTESKDDAKPDEAAESTGDDDLDEMNDYASQVAASKAKKIEEDEETKRLKSVEHLIESRKYAVPINAVHRRHTKNVAVVVLLLALVAAAVVGYILFV